MSKHVLRPFLAPVPPAGEAAPTEQERWVTDARLVMEELADLLEIFLRQADHDTIYWRRAVAAIAKARWLEEHLEQ